MFPLGKGFSNGNSFNRFDLDPLGQQAKSEPYLLTGLLLGGAIW